MHISINILHEYYTPISIKRQASLDKIAIFVDYDHFYVNIVMLTAETAILHCLPFQTISYILRNTCARGY